MRYPFLFFDADHTLFDFDAAEEASLKRAVISLHSDGFQHSWLAAYQKANKHVWKAYEAGSLSVAEVKQKRFQDFVQLAGIAVSPADLSQRYVEELAKCTMLLPDAEKLLDELQRRGHQMLLLTNGLSEIQRPRFRNSAIARYFKTFVISDELGVAKPDPKIFSVALQAFDCPDKSQVLMIGDNLRSDIVGGIGSGIATCWFNPSHAACDPEIKPDFEVTQLLDLLELV
ncbi:MAG: pyrimidine 5'-nucleotidase [Planctomycetota bacterium]